MKKKILAMILGIAMLFGGMMGVFAATESAELTITTFVGETTANSGVRLTQDVSTLTGSTATFDTAFASAVSALTLGNTTIDNSTADVSGTFSVLFRRPVTTTATVSISAAPLLSGTSFIEYTLTSGTTLNSGGNDIVVSNTTKTDVYTVTNTGYIRNQNIFTYLVPANTSAPLGTYSSTITFTMTVS